MKDRKAAKKIIKIAKKNPQLYTNEEVQYAKLFRRVTKKNAGSEISNSNSKGGRDYGVRGKSEQPKESGQSKGSWFVKLLHKARSLVGL